MAIALTLPQVRTSAFVCMVHKLLRPLWVYSLLHRRFSNLRLQKILVYPIDMHLSDPVMAHEFYHGRFAFAGKIVHSGSVSPFSVMVPTVEWEEALHDFHWLRHMTAAQSELVAAHARSLLEDWLDRCGKDMKGIPWDGSVVARRLISWICHAQTLLQGASERFEKRFLQSLWFQSRYLSTSIYGIENNDQRLRAAVALTFASLVLPVSTAMKKRARAHLTKELSHQILIDGGHISRNPAVLLNLLSDLLSLRHLYMHSNEMAPRTLVDSIERMLPALRFFVHEDKMLAQFNGVGPIAPAHLSSILDRDETVGQPFSYARYSGFQRLCANQTTVLADTGKFPPRSAAEYACSGCLSFEMSSLGSRFIINTGVNPRGQEEYRRFGRITAAHSTATVNDCSVGILRKKRNSDSSVLLKGPTDVKVQRIEDSEKIGFIASHDGYAQPFNLIHERGLILAKNGAIIEGFDRFFTPQNGRLGKNQGVQNPCNIVTVRFHIHPQVEVNYNGSVVRLSVESGQMWYFTSPDSDIYLENSIDFAGLSGPQRTQQIVLYFRPAAQEKIRWRFIRHKVGETPVGCDNHEAGNV